MNETLAMQLLIFGYSCALGAGLGLLYDFFRIVRMMINPHNIAVFIQDVVYFIISGIITFLFVLGFNSGEARFYILAGEGIGWIIYHITLGEVIYRCSGGMVRFFSFKIKHISNKIKNFVNFTAKNKQKINN